MVLCRKRETVGNGLLTLRPGGSRLRVFGGPGSK